MTASVMAREEHLPGRSVQGTGAARTSSRVLIIRVVRHMYTYIFENKKHGGTLLGGPLVGCDPSWRERISCAYILYMTGVGGHGHHISSLILDLRIAPKSRM